MTTRLNPEQFAIFAASKSSMTWPERPEWLQPYWKLGRKVAIDLAIFHADLDAKVASAEEFLAHFIAWKLRS